MNYKDILEVPRVPGRVQSVRVTTAPVAKKVYTDLVKSKIFPILGEQTMMDDQHKDFTGTP